MGYILACAVLVAITMSIASDKVEKPRERQNLKLRDEWDILEEYLSSEDEDI